MMLSNIMIVPLMVFFPYIILSSQLSLNVDVTTVKMTENINNQNCLHDTTRCTIRPQQRCVESSRQHQSVVKKFLWRTHITFLFYDKQVLGGIASFYSLFLNQTIARVAPHIVATSIKPENQIHVPGEEISVTYNKPVCSPIHQRALMSQ